MNYKVLIKQCENPRRAAVIAEEVARRAGVAPEAVRLALLENAICIKQRAQQREAMLLKEAFEAVGAEVDFVEEMAPPHSPVIDDEELEDADGRILTEEEFMERLNGRMDIFRVEKDDRLRRIEDACLVAGIASGIWMTKHEMAPAVDTDFYTKIPQEVSVRMLPPEAAPELPKKPEQKNMNVAVQSEKKTLTKDHSIGHGGEHGGGGDVRARVTKMGVLGILAQKVTGKSIASADIFGKDGFAKDIDVIISGTNGLKSDGSGGVGRRRETGIGFQTGVGSGTGGTGSGGIEDIMGSLMPSASDLKLAHHEFKHTLLDLTGPGAMPTSGIMIGGRSRASIMHVVMQNITVLRYAYNKRLREKPSLKGKIACKFAIDEFGKIVFCEMTETTIFDPMLEAEIVAKIHTWVFDKIDKPGDITEVVYPFAFSQ